VSTRGLVLDALRESSDKGISGETLAKSLGMSRVAISKHVSALRALGYDIPAVPGSGYRLVGVPDLALPLEVAPLVNDRFWCAFEGGVETGSTNDDARALARAGATEGTVVVAARQTKGRGRLGREWESPAGGAYFSAILRPSIAPSQAGPMALIVALGVAKGLETLGLRVGLKWPNDLQIDGRKLAGILLEMSSEGELIQWVVAGVGINVARSNDASDGAVYVSDLLENLTAARVAAAALDGISAAYAQWIEAGFDSMRSAYLDRFVQQGRSVVVRDLAGTVRASGVVRGIDAEGRLLVEGDSGLEAVASGEVTLRS